MPKMKKFGLLTTFCVGLIIVTTTCDESCDTSIQKLNDIAKSAEALKYKVQKYNVKLDEKFFRFVEYLLRVKKWDEVAGISPKEVENIFSTRWQKSRDNITIYRIDLEVFTPDLFTRSSSPWYMLTKKAVNEITSDEESFVQSDQPVLMSKKDHIQYQLRLGPKIWKPENIKVKLDHYQKTRFNGYIIAEPRFTLHLQGDETHIGYSLMVYDDSVDLEPIFLMSKAEKEKKRIELKIMGEVSKYLKEKVSIMDLVKPLRLEYSVESEASLMFFDDDHIRNVLEEFVECSSSGKTVVDVYGAVKRFITSPKVLRTFKKGGALSRTLRSAVPRAMSKLMSRLRYFFKNSCSYVNVNLGEGGPNMNGCSDVDDNADEDYPDMNGCPDVDDNGDEDCPDMNGCPDVYNNGNEDCPDMNGCPDVDYNGDEHCPNTNGCDNTCDYETPSDYPKIPQLSESMSMKLIECMIDKKCEITKIGKLSDLEETDPQPAGMAANAFEVGQRQMQPFIINFNYGSGGVGPARPTPAPVPGNIPVYQPEMPTDDEDCETEEAIPSEDPIEPSGCGDDIESIGSECPGEEIEEDEGNYESLPGCIIGVNCRAFKIVPVELESEKRESPEMFEFETRKEPITIRQILVPAVEEIAAVQPVLMSLPGESAGALPDCQSSNCVAYEFSMELQLEPRVNRVEPGRFSAFPVEENLEVIPACAIDSTCAG